MFLRRLASPHNVRRVTSYYTFRRVGALVTSSQNESWTAPKTTTTTTTRTKSTVARPTDYEKQQQQQQHSLNEDNMIPHHDPHEPQPPVQWSTMFDGKVSVLEKDEVLAAAVANDTTSSSSTTKDSNDKDGKEQEDEPEEIWTDDFNYGDTPRTSVLMELTDRGVGVLHDVLRYFWKYDVNICRIESRPQQLGKLGRQRRMDFFVDLEGSCEEDENVHNLLNALRSITDKILILDEKRVHWFPRHISELDLIAHRTLDAGKDLEADHPGFSDPVYRSRRALLATAAQNHVWNKPIPTIDYTPEETSVWTAVWDKMQPLLEKYACKEYLVALQQMKQHCGYSRDTIPQQETISEYLQRRTNFRMRPVAGLLSSRDFLNGLAFRVFFSTQYIRHHSRPLYTPEPDICHELLGHAPMFADHDFADFSQEIGLASLGASDEDVDKLAHCYWHSVEFGLCQEDGKNKAYGAGLLSSFGELEHACGEGDGTAPRPEIKPWDPEVAAKQEFPITTYQPVYFLAESLQDAKQKMRLYCEDLPRPFFALHNEQTNTVHIDRPVKRTKGVPK